MEDNSIKQILNIVKKHFEFEQDSTAIIILRLNTIAEEIRALSSRLDLIDYNTQWTHDKLSKHIRDR